MRKPRDWFFPRVQYRVEVLWIEEGPGSCVVFFFQGSTSIEDLSFLAEEVDKTTTKAWKDGSGGFAMQGATVPQIPRHSSVPAPLGFMWRQHATPIFYQPNSLAIAKSRVRPLPRGCSAC